MTDIWGDTDDMQVSPTFVALGDVEQERIRQDARWGPQCGKNTDHVWLAVLAEEVGECANALLRSRPEDGSPTDWRAELRAELVQVAAVAVAWVECLDSRAG